MPLRFLSSGESHGPELNIILEGIPANMPLLEEDINLDLKRRQGGYGRGGRMKIETDKVFFTAGIRHGRTFGGAPIAMKIINKDHQKWLNVMSSSPVDTSDPKVKAELDAKYISKVRPGHADFAGALKYDAPDVRDILERSSARETTSRVAAGAVCKTFLKQFGIEIFSHVLTIGELSIDATAIPDQTSLSQFKEQVESSELRIYDPSGKKDQEFKDYIDSIRKKGDTLGGIVEVFALGVPVGLGSHVQWDRRIDGLIAQAMMSTHTVKSVEIGLGEAVGRIPGSQVHDQIYRAEDKNPLHYERKTNNLGGTEGGMTNGMPITCKVGVKPIPTLISKLDSIDLDTKANAESHFERSDICVVPAAGVVLEAMMAIVLAQCFLEKFGGDSIAETKRNYDSYQEQISEK
ncbi:MAG: chorismate synthase [Cyanobacteria bacterium]|nr:chorismate synthase [Cyanobacteriota bacterium]MDA1020597.1 chorismate synthase [Cyanobacteriota bacterium]